MGSEDIQLVFRANTTEAEAATKRMEDGMSRLGKAVDGISERKAGRGVAGLVNDFAHAGSAADGVIATMHRLERVVNVGLGGAVAISGFVAGYEAMKAGMEKIEEASHRLNEAMDFRVPVNRSIYSVNELRAAIEKLDKAQEGVQKEREQRNGFGEYGASMSARYEEERKKHGVIASGAIAWADQFGAYTGHSNEDALNDKERKQDEEYNRARKEDMRALADSAAGELSVLRERLAGNGEEVELMEAQKKAQKEIFDLQMLGAHLAAERKQQELAITEAIIRQKGERATESMRAANELADRNSNLTGSDYQRKQGALQNQADSHLSAAERYRRYGGDNAEEKALSEQLKAQEALAEMNRNDIKRKQEIRQLTDEAADISDQTGGAQERNIRSLERQVEAERREMDLRHQQGIHDEALDQTSKNRIAKAQSSIQRQKTEQAWESRRQDVEEEKLGIEGDFHRSGFKRKQEMRTLDRDFAVAQSNRGDLDDSQRRAYSIEAKKAQLDLDKMNRHGENIIASSKSRMFGGNVFSYGEHSANSKLEHIGDKQLQTLQAILNALGGKENVGAKNARTKLQLVN